MREIAVLARRYGYRIIDDALHAMGGRYLEAPVGGCGFADIAVFSFHPVKVITTGEGGQAVTNDTNRAAHMKRHGSHDFTRDDTLMTEPT